MLPMIGSRRWVITASFCGSASRDTMTGLAALLLTLLAHATASDPDSCMGRCENGFDATRECQCDSMCKYYKSCCSDFEATCGMMTRGDTFVVAEDDGDLFERTTPSPGLTPPSPLGRQPGLTPPARSDFSRRQQQHDLDTLLHMTRPPRTKNVPTEQETPAPQTVPPAQDALTTTEAPPTEVAVETTTAAPTTPGTTEAPDPDAVVCSGRPFDAFMQLKNGSIFAFRGDYFFELNDQAVLPGYPKLIKDVWGIKGPIDAAFTRVNCQGKTYIFKGNSYWRFDDGVLDEDYPRDISVGFDKIPDHVDAAFALPAPGHNGREKVYFFKGDQYYTYEFLHQPSHEECVTMSERSPSTLFRRYTDIYYPNYEPFFSELFSSSPQHHDKHHFIDKDWKGLKSPVDAVMAGRMYVPPSRPAGRRSDHQQNQPYQPYQPYQQYQQYGQQYGQQYQQYGQQYQQWGRRRQSRSPFWESMAERGMAMGQGFAERGMEMGLRLAERRMEMEERLGRDWDRGWAQDWDQDRRSWRDRDTHRQNNRGNYDSRGDRSYLEPVHRELPIQTVYFFKGDRYYRVDLKSKRVDPAMPPYPRSIGKYWLGCSGTAGLEK